MKTGLKFYCATILLTAATILNLCAAVIPGVSVIGVSSEYVSGRDQRRGTNVLGGIGLFGDVHTTDPAGNMWMTSATATNTGAFANAFLTFDLGANYTVSRLKVWNFNGPTNGAGSGAGVHTAAISYSTDNVTYTTNLPSANFNAAPLLFTNFGQTIDMGAVLARYVRINVQTIYAATTTSNRVGLAKVQFVDDTVPPTVLLATRNFSANQVTVQFSESVLPSTATNIANYSIQSGGTTATIQSAAMGTYNDTVVLQTSPLNTNLTYTITAQNVRDAANIISIASTNLTIGSELVAWLQADNGVTADGSGFVSQWNDQSGNANNAVNATNGTQPTLTSSAINGLPAVHFDGTSQLLEIPFNSTLAANRDFTFYIVMSADSADPGAVQGPISLCYTNVPGHFDFQIARTTGKLSFLRGNRYGLSSFAATAAIVPAQYYLVSFVMRGTNATAYLNGSFNGRSAFTTGIYTVGNPVRIGLRQDSATKFRGYIAEAMLFRGAVSDAERLQLDTYIANKYALPIVTLAITQQPTSITRLAGQRASFGVVAVAGSPTINYQWQKGGVNIPNATNANYTTPVLAQTDTGTSYQVIVSTPSGSTATSTAATLTVQANTQAPTLMSASRVAGSATDILLAYSIAMNPASATSIANYSLNNGATISSATVGSSPNQVVLTTSGLTSSNAYYLSAQNVKDTFNNTMVPTATLVLSSNLSIWLKADSGVITDIPGFVNEWDDQSANTNNALQFSQADRMPAYASGAINGLPAARFDGLSNYLEAALSPSLAFNSDMTIYVIANFTDFTGP
ncbi:MAG: LamG-like jellyroll fold domain-containing protein, partial [Limisphaerales bacterium]